MNVISELIGFVLMLLAYDTLAIGLPIYLVPLVMRVLLEERTMRDRLSAYRSTMPNPDVAACLVR